MPQNPVIYRYLSMVLVRVLFGTAPMTVSSFWPASSNGSRTIASACAPPSLARSSNAPHPHPRHNMSSRSEAAADAAAHCFRGLQRNMPDKSASRAVRRHSPFLKIITVGMLRMPYSVAMLGLSSVLSFTCESPCPREWGE